MTFVRYIGIQLLAYCIDISVFMLVLNIELFAPVWANVIAKVGAGLFGFTAHRHFTFQVANDAAPRGQVIRYFFLLAMNIPVASAILTLLLMYTLKPVYAKLIADVICVGITFLLSKHFIFVSPPKQAGKADPTGFGK